LSIHFDYLFVELSIPSGTIKSNFSLISTSQYSQISFNELVIGKELGEGSFGRVYLGKWRSAFVALKFCQTGKIDEFMKEMNLMTYLEICFPMI
jgi:predicted Ser/Thr protein kinase